MEADFTNLEKRLQFGTALPPCVFQFLKIKSSFIPADKAIFLIGTYKLVEPAELVLGYKHGELLVGMLDVREMKVAATESYSGKLRSSRGTSANNASTSRRGIGGQFGAIFDAKWLPSLHKNGDSPFTYAMTCDASGYLSLFRVHLVTLSIDLVLQSSPSKDEPFSYTYFDTFQRADDTVVAVGRDDGYIEIFQLTDEKSENPPEISTDSDTLENLFKLIFIARWKAHSEALWMVKISTIVNCESLVLFSGGDDSFFCGWILSASEVDTLAESFYASENTTLFASLLFSSNHGHDAGVTCIHLLSEPGNNEFLVFTGSYDGILSFWRIDSSLMSSGPSSRTSKFMPLWSAQLNVGSIWRLVDLSELTSEFYSSSDCKESNRGDPATSTFGVAGMYEGASIIDLVLPVPSSRSLPCVNVRWKYKHTSMMYGLDVIVNPPENQRLLGMCSFYDCLVSIHQLK